MQHYSKKIFHSTQVFFFLEERKVSPNALSGKLKRRKNFLEGRFNFVKGRFGKCLTACALREEVF